MKSTGIVRKVDELGRIVIPIETRHILKIAPRDPIEIYREGDQIILHKYDPDNSCIFCGRNIGVKKFKGQNICQSCRAELKRQH